MSTKPATMSETLIKSRNSLLHCPLCSLRMSKFFCVDCVISGHFVHSNTDLFETFSEKSLRLFALQTEIAETKNAIDDRTKNVWKKERMKEEIELSKARAKYLKHAVKNNLVKKSKNLELLSRASPRHIELPHSSSEISIMKAFKDQITVKSCIIKDQMEDTKRDLREAQSMFIKSLQSTIFPVVIFQDITDSSSTNLMLDTMKDAMETSYTTGKWVTMDMSSYPQGRMVSSAIPAVEVDKIPLSLACQFTNIVADVLGRHLPTRVSILDLEQVYTDKENLVRNVAMLNMNVVTMCMVFRVEQRNIRPEQVLHNLHQMIIRVRECLMENDDDLVVSEVGRYDMMNSMNVEKDDTDSDEEWEKVMNGITDQDWESLDKPSYETWEGLSIPVDFQQSPAKMSAAEQSNGGSRMLSNVSSLLWGDFE